jgi:hypothetical protein
MIPQLSRISAATMLFGVFLYMTGSTDDIHDDIKPLLSDRIDHQYILAVARVICEQIQIDSANSNSNISI